jgi:uncharacterized protein (TIGR02391 family)
MELNNSIIKKELWDVIENYYEKELYDEALRKACLFIIKLIQEKSDCYDKDGEKLIDYVFLKQPKPIIIINKYETETDMDEQRGFAFLLKGLICTTRNPLSHELNFPFNKEAVESIILFINNYILEKLIIESKEFSYVQNWYNFVFNDNITDDKDYYDVILNNISKPKRLELLKDVLENIRNIEKDRYKYFIKKLLLSLSEKQKKEFNEILNKKLIHYIDDREFIMFLDHFPPIIWNELDLLVKTRLEKIILQSLKSGEMDSLGGKVTDGFLAPWATEYIDYFVTKDEFYETIFSKLNFSEKEGIYVITYFRDVIINDKNIKNKDIVTSIRSGLKNGNPNYKNLISYEMDFDKKNNKWKEKLKVDYEDFNDKDFTFLPW